MSTRSRCRHAKLRSMTAMLSEELKSLVRQAVNRARDRELNFQRVLLSVPGNVAFTSKPRIRVKAASHRWTLPSSSEAPKAVE